MDVAFKSTQNMKRKLDHNILFALEVYPILNFSLVIEIQKQGGASIGGGLLLDNYQ